MNYSSKLLEKAVEEFAKLPGIGKKTALRLVLNLLNREVDDVTRFATAITSLREEIRFCKKCHNISDIEICQLCSNPSRDNSILCVVEDIRDVMAIENTQQYRGLYHVLGGVISPMDGIGPQHLNIESLIDKVNSGEVKEIIFALSTTMEGDTTNFYIFKKLKETSVKVSTIARGIAFGDELEYADEITLGRSIANRLPYESSINS
ncbi:MAG: recombination protein RecR [Bacteroidetes bacterium MED-G21]|nr:MAG: recombination protein RecR [Bacteroidetes bacterium MED-G21]